MRNKGSNYTCISEKRVLDNTEFSVLDYNSGSKFTKISDGLNGVQRELSRPAWFEILIVIGRVGSAAFLSQ